MLQLYHLGRPSDDLAHPDYVPNINMGYDVNSLQNHVWVGSRGQKKG